MAKLQSNGVRVVLCRFEDSVIDLFSCVLQHGWWHLPLVVSRAFQNRVSGKRRVCIGMRGCPIGLSSAWSQIRAEVLWQAHVADSLASWQSSGFGVSPAES